MIDDSGLPARVLSGPLVAVLSNVSTSTLTSQQACKSLRHVSALALALSELLSFVWKKLGHSRAFGGECLIKLAIDDGALAGHLWRNCRKCTGS